MKISDIRTYLKTQINLVSSAFEEWTDGFNFENVPSNKQDYSYHITINIPSIADGDNWIEESHDITIQFGFKGGNNVQDALFSAMDIVDDVKLKIINRESLNTYVSLNDFEEPLVKVIPNSQVAEPLPTNDDRFIITLSLTGIIFKTYCN